MDKEADGFAQASIGEEIPLTGIERQQKIALIQLLLQYSTYEANVYWQRNTLFITINSALLGLTVAAWAKVPSYCFIVEGCLGAYLCFMWIGLLAYGKFLAEKWREDARALARTDEELRYCLRALLGRPRIRIPAGMKPSQAIKNICVLFSLMWLLVAVVAGFRCYKQYTLMRPREVIYSVLGP